MNIDVLQGMLNNSIWTDPENESDYKFSNGNDLTINGNDHLPYSLYVSGNKILLQFGSKKSYTIEYVDDFNLNLYNGNEKIRIMPE